MSENDLKVIDDNYIIDQEKKLLELTEKMNNEFQDFTADLNKKK